MLKLFKNKDLKQGFSLPEIIVVLACLAVVISISYQDMLGLFDKQMVEQEKLDLGKVYDAIQLYAENEGSLPDNDSLCDVTDSTSWAVKLAKYAELTPTNICFDRWGQRRYYQTHKIQQNFNGGAYNYSVYFASVLSAGPNRVKDTTDWANISGFSGFTQFDADLDDLVIKYNDNAFKLRRYEETLARIEKLEAALERYARGKRYGAISADVFDYENYIMYPKDNRSADPGNYLTSGSVSGLNSANEVETIAEEIKAVELAKVLGVPEYWGRNALTGKSMWYISNPGIDRENPCDGANSTAPFFPPVVFVTTDDLLPNGC